jgi:hypothetical protein
MRRLYPVTGGADLLERLGAQLGRQKPTIALHKFRVQIFRVRRDKVVAQQPKSQEVGPLLIT